MAFEYYILNLNYVLELRYESVNRKKSAI